jgi:predicted DNA-binding protein
MAPGTRRVVEYQSKYDVILFQPSQTMTITIDLSPEMEKKLLARSAATGKNVTTLVEEAIEAKLKEPLPTYDEVLAPIREGFAQSGMSEDEADQILQQTLAKVRAERRKQAQ